MIYYLFKYKLFSALIIVCMLAIPIIFLSLPNNNTSPRLSGPTPTLKPGQFLPPQKISSLQKTSIGKVPSSDLTKTTGFLNKETLPSGRVKYDFESPINSRNNEIITRDGKVVYERGLAPQSPESPGYTTITSIAQLYGQPDRVISGSKFYGWPLKQYIYASKGFSFIGNQNNNEVYEMSFFEPMSTERYISEFGVDIDSESSAPIEIH